MNKRIRNLIDDIFAEMKMTAENLALRDELMANAQAHYEDEIAKGKTEEQALEEVASSLGDVRSLLASMNGMTEEVEADEETVPEAEEAQETEADWNPMQDIGATLDKAWTSIGEFGKQIVPQMERIVRKADEATNGALSDLGKTVSKGVRDMTKAASDTIDWFAGKDSTDAEFVAQEDPAALREKAKDIRAQAELKQAAGDQEGARDMRRIAYEMEMKAEALEQEAEIRKAQADAEKQQEEAHSEKPEESWVGPDGQIDQDAFSKVVDELADKAEQAAKEANRAARNVQETVTDAVVTKRFPVAGLHRVEINLSADDVTLQPSDEPDVTIKWESNGQDVLQPDTVLEDHTLKICNRNPDVFKTFFSVFKKEGGRLTVSVPKGISANYSIVTTSGDIAFLLLDADELQANSTSGSVRLEPDARVRLKNVSVNTVSGGISVSACAEDVAVKTISGEVFVSVDALSVDADAVSGKLHVEGACDQWDVTTVSGECELLCTVVPMGKISIGSISGSARVALPTDIRGFVAENTGINGSISNEFGPNRYGTCALPIRMETMSGKLTITRL